MLRESAVETYTALAERPEENLDQFKVEILRVHQPRGNQMLVSFRISLPKIRVLRVS